MTRWEHMGRFEYAPTREAAAVLFGATDPNEVRFAGWSERAKLTVKAIRLGVGDFFVPFSRDSLQPIRVSIRC